jgi:nucleoid DNA-binding protein
VEEGLGGQHFGQCPRSGDVVQVSGFGTAEVLEQFRVERHGRNVVAMVDEE